MMPDSADRCVTHSRACLWGQAELYAGRKRNQCVRRWGGIVWFMEDKRRCEILLKVERIPRRSRSQGGGLPKQFSISFCRLMAGLCLISWVWGSVPILIRLLLWWELSTGGQEGPTHGSCKWTVRWGERTGQIPELPIPDCILRHNLSQNQSSSSLPNGKDTGAARMEMEKCVSIFKRVDWREGACDLEEISPRKNSRMDHHIHSLTTLRKKGLITRSSQAH